MTSYVCKSRERNVYVIFSYAYQIKTNDTSILKSSCMSIHINQLFNKYFEQCPGYKNSVSIYFIHRKGILKNFSYNRIKRKKFSDIKLYELFSFIILIHLTHNKDICIIECYWYSRGINVIYSYLIVLFWNHVF